MQYINKYVTEDQIKNKFKYKETVGDAYFDEHGILKPGHCNRFEVGHFSILALMEWGQQNTYVKEQMYEKHKLRFTSYNTIFNYEIQTLVSMMHWDEFNKLLKYGMIMNHLKNKGTTFEKQCKKAELMKKEQDRLFDIGEVKVRLRKTRGRWCWNFLAATHIQRWWLRKKRKFRIYKNVYQLMDEYSVEGGFTGQDSATYLGRGKNLLKIQEDIMNKVLARRIKCAEVSKQFIGDIFKDVFRRQSEHSYNKMVDEFVYGLGSCDRWTKDGGTEPYLCATCATTDCSYPGGGRAFGNLMHPRWAAACSKCGKKNPFYREKYVRVVREMSPSPPPYNGGSLSFLGKWARRLGLTR